MRILTLIAIVFFVLSFFYPGSAQQGFRPHLLDQVPGLSELQLMEWRKPLMEAHLAEDGPAARKALERIRQRLSPQQIAALNALPEEPQDQRHYHRGRVLTLEDLTPQQRDVLSRLVEAVAERDTQEDEPEALESRFWSLAGVILSPEQMTQAKSLLPHHYQTELNPDNFLQLDSLDGSMANRVLSNFRNFESETSGLRTRMELLEKEPESPERLQEMVKLRLEILTLRNQRLEAVLDLLTDEQSAQYNAIPPYTSLSQLNHLAEYLTEPARWTEEQRQVAGPVLAQLHQEWEKAEPEIRQQAEELEDPEGRGQMSKMMATRSRIKPFERRRLEVARQIARLMTDEQLERLLEQGSNLD